MRKAVAAAVACFAVLSWASPASAAGEGTLAIVPAEGTLDTPMDVVTSGVCSQGVTFVVAVRGAGIDPVTAGNAVGNTELAVLEPAIYPGHHAVPLARTLREFFVSHGVSTPKGTYDLVFACRNRLDLQDLQTFTGALRIKGDSYVALGAAATPVAEFVSTPDPAQESSATVPGDAGSDSTSDAAQESSGAGSQGQERDQSGSGSGEGGQAAGSAGAADPGAEDAALPAQEVTGSDPTAVALTGTSSSSASPTSEDSSWRMIALVAGALLILGAAYAYWRGRRHEISSDESVSVGS
ncbi:MAG: hypothetical protein RL134_1977 [Actinomycetota bacterium]|jgi:hypothetical protein